MQYIRAHNARMDLNNLQLFMEVVRRGNFASVARDRGIASSSVSRAIASLEEELGVRLFQRSTRRLVLTEAGQHYFETVEGAIEEIIRAGEQASELTENPRGTLRVTASATFGQIAIVPLLPEFTRQYPELDIELLLTDSQLDLVAERIDVAIRIGNMTDTSLVATRLCSVPYRLCASTDYLSIKGTPARPADLISHDCLCLHLPDYDSWVFRGQDGRTEIIKVHRRVVISNVQALKQCALSSMGVALLPEWVVQKELIQDALVNVLPEYTVGVKEFNIPVWLLYPSRRHLPLKVKVFADFIRGRFRSSLPWM